MNRLLFISCFLLLSIGTIAQTSCNWPSGFAINVSDTLICPEQNDTLSISNSAANTNYAWYKLESSNWGTNNLNGSAPFDIETAHSDTVFGLFTNQGVYKLDSNSWVQVTTSLPSSETPLSLAISDSNNIYVATKNSSSNRASVWKWIGSAWTAIGNQSFTTQNPEYLDLEIDALERPLIAFANDSANDYATVMRYNGSSWGTLGSIQASAEYALGLDLEISSSNVPYFAIQPGASAYGVKVYKYSGSSWSSIGTGAVPYTTFNMDLEIIGSTPYLACQISYSGDKIHVYRNSGSSWTTLSPFSGSTTSGTYPQIEESNGDLILSYYYQGSRKFFKREGSTWLDYMVENDNSNLHGSMKIGYRGFPVSIGSGGIYTYQDQPFNTNPMDTFQVVNTAGLYLAVRYNGCGLYSRVLEEVKAEEISYTVNIDHVNCYGDSTGNIFIYSYGNNAVTGYLWENGDTNNTILGKPAATYQVTLSGDECIFQDSIEIFQTPLIQNTFSISNVSCSGKIDGVITPSTTGGAGDMFYSINGYISDSTQLEYLPSGTYEVITTDSLLCQVRDSVSVGTTTNIIQPNINGGYEQTLCNDSVLMATPGQTYGSNIWKKWFNLNWQHKDNIGSTYSSSRYPILQQKNGNLVFKRSYYEVSRLSGGILNDITPNVGGPSSSILSGGLDYVDGWLLYSRYTYNQLTVYRRSDDQNQWEELPTIPNSYGKSTIAYEYLDGKLVVLLSSVSGSDTVTFWQYEDDNANWIELEPFGSGYLDKLQMVTAPNGLIYAVGCNFLGGMYLKEFDGNNWNTILSGISCEEQAYDLIIDHNGYPVFTYIEEGQNQPCTIQRYINGSWQSLGLIDSAGINVVLRSSFDGGLYALIGEEYNKTLYRQINNEWIQISNQFNHSNSIINYDFQVDNEDTIHIYFGNSIAKYYTISPEIISTQDSAFATEDGYYSITAGSQSCSGLKGFQMINPAPDINAHIVKGVSCKNAFDGKLEAYIAPNTGTGNFIYQWSTGSTQDTIQNLQGGLYVLTVTDDDNCVVTDSVGLFEPDSLVINQINAFAPSCSDGNDGSVIADVTGGRTPYNFTWSDNWINVPHDSIGLASGNYTVYVNDTAGCSDSTSFSVPSSTTIVNPPIISPGNPNLCALDSLVLTANSNVNQFQWYNMKNGAYSDLGGTFYRSFLSSQSSTVVDIETDPLGKVYVAASPASNSTSLNNVFVYDGISWSQLGSNYSNNVTAYTGTNGSFAMELDSNNYPVVAYERLTGGVDSILIVQWNGYNWNRIHEVSGSESISSFDLHRDKLTGKLILAYIFDNTSGIHVEEFINGQFQSTSYSPIGSSPGTKLDIESSPNGNLYLLHGATNLWDTAKVLYEVNGASITTISVPLEGALANKSSVKVNSQGVPYIHINSGIYHYLSNGSWNRLGNENYDFEQPRSIMAISPSDNIIYNYSSRTLIYNGSNWDTLFTAYLSAPTDIAFTPEGLPLIAKQHYLYPRVWEYHPTLITGATNPNYTLQNEAALWVTASDGTCVKGNYTSVNKPQITEIDNEFINCPGDSTLLTISTTGAGDSLSYIWNTGDTTPSIGLQPAGTYTVTITGGTCPAIIDTINVETNPQVIINIDSVSPVTCPGGQDGTIEVSIQSLVSYTYTWSDYPNYNSLTRDGFAPGIYTVSATINGCTNGDSVNVIISEPTPFSTPSIIGSQNQSLCENDSLLISTIIDTTISIQWMSYDSISTRNIGGLLSGDIEMSVIERNGIKYTLNRNVNNYPTLYKLEGERWVEVWSDTLLFQKYGDLTIDSVGNLILAYPIENGWNDPRLRVMRIGQDTSLILEIQGSYNYIVTPILEWLNNDLFIGFVNSSSNYISTNNSGRFTSYLWNGNSLDTLPILNFGNGEEYFRWGRMRTIQIEVDDNNDLWMAYQNTNNWNRMVRYSGGGWISEHSSSIYSSFNFQPWALHKMPDGTIFSVLEYYNSLGEGTLITKYDQGQWDTITSRHAQMSNLNHIHDISNDPFGRPLLLEGEAIYTLQDTGWMQIVNDLTSIGSYAKFVEQECSYPMLAWDISFNSTTLTELLPSEIIGNGSTVYVNQPGIYQPIAENNGCFNYQSCPVLVSLGFNANIMVQQDVLCAGSNSGSLFAEAEEGSQGSLSYSWSTGDSTMSIDSISAGTYYLTITDASGCASSDSITLSDPAPIQIQSIVITNNDCGGNPTGAIQLSASGGSGALSIQWNTGDSTFGLSNLVDTTYLASVTDTNGCQIDSAIVLHPLDTIPPSLSAQDITIYMDSTGLAIANPTNIDPNITDNCGIQEIILSTDTFDCSLSGINSTTIQVIDSSGNVSIDTFMVTVIDSTLPVLYSATFDVYLNINGQATLTTSTVDSGSFDNCGIDTMYLSQNLFSCLDVGLDSVWFYAIDESGNIDSLNVYFNVLDTIAPVITTGTLATYVDSTGTSVLDSSQVTSMVTENCSIDSIWWNPGSFSCSIPVDSVTVYATDINGNQDSLTIPINVVDTITPVLYSYQQVQVLLDSMGLYVLAPSILDSASFDNCGIDTLFANADTFTCADIGLHSVLLTAIDYSGNTNSTTIQVLVSDESAPTLLVQEDTIYLDINGQANTSVTQVNIGTWDSCGIQSLSLSQTNFDCSNIGSNSVWFVAADVNGNSDSTLVNIQVEDTISPTVLMKQADTIYLNTNGLAQLAANQLDLGSTDNCSGITFTASDSVFDCQDTGLQTISVTITDAGGNSQTEPVTLLVLDTISPTITCPSDASICEGEYTFNDPSYADNCSATISQLSGPSSGSILTPGNYTIEYEVVDFSGNLTTCSYELEVTPEIEVDLGNDTALIPGQSITLNAGPTNWNYQWSTGNNSNSITITPSFDTLIWVTASNENCTDSDSILIDVLVGVKPSERIVNSFQVYPNPTDGEFWLKFISPPQSAITITVYTSAGQMVKSTVEPSSDRVHLDLSHFAQGIYWLEIKADDEINRTPVSVY